MGQIRQQAIAQHLACCGDEPKRWGIQVIALRHPAVCGDTPALAMMRKAERVAGGIEHHAPALTGLVGRLRSTEGFGELHRILYLIDSEIEVHLRSPLLRWPSQRLTGVDLLKHEIQGRSREYSVKAILDLDGPVPSSG